MNLKKTVKRRLTNSERFDLDRCCLRAKQQGHKINVLLVGSAEPIQICAQAWLPELVLGIVRMAWKQYPVTMLVEADRVPLLVIDSKGNEETFTPLPTEGQRPTIDEFHQAFHGLTLTIGDWLKMEDYLYGEHSDAIKAFS